MVPYHISQHEIKITRSQIAVLSLIFPLKTHVKSRPHSPNMKLGVLNQQREKVVVVLSTGTNTESSA